MSFCQDLLNLELQSKHVPQFYAPQTKVFREEEIPQTR